MKREVFFEKESNGMKREVVFENEFGNNLYFRARAQGGFVWNQYIVQKKKVHFYVYLFDNIYLKWFRFHRRFETLDKALIEFGFKEAYEPFKKGGYTNK